MYLEFPTANEAMERRLKAAQAVGHGHDVIFSGNISQTNSDTFMWEAKGPLTEDEEAQLVSSYEPKAWEDLI